MVRFPARWPARGSAARKPGSPFPALVAAMLGVMQRRRAHFDTAIHGLHRQSAISPYNQVMLSLRTHASLDEINAADWDALVGDDHPFVSHAFLAGLERTGCIREALGWRAQHLTLHEGDALVGALPLYLKGNSHGEYVFDWSWAHAWERAGGDYYPKLLCAVPYSPVTGPRLLAATNPALTRCRTTLARAAAAHARTGAVVGPCEFPARGRAGRLRSQPVGVPL
jgi:predicted N-acyltransferase